MKHQIALILLLFIAGYSTTIHAQSGPLAHTYSIVAFDEKTGEMGVAVQSHWFSVGTIVIWGEAGTGVVATQSFVNPAYGPNGLELLRQGLSPRQALDYLLSTDEAKDFRQAAVLNHRGEVAAFTGNKCIQDAGHQEGKGYSVQANLMLNPSIWPAMATAFEESAELPLAERLLVTLEAAERAGGDIRGRQSAALLVVAPKNTGMPWKDRLVDIRVDDHAEPLAELRRILKTHRAYEHMNRGDLAVEKGDLEVALEEYRAAEWMFPDNEEMKYWHAVSLVNAGKLEAALPLFREVFLKNNNWKTLTPRLIQNGLLLADEASLFKILTTTR